MACHLPYALRAAVDGTATLENILLIELRLSFDVLRKRFLMVLVYRSEL